MPTAKNPFGSPATIAYFPDLTWKRDVRGKPLSHLDLDELNLSVRRLKSSIWLREIGNSLRVWFGQTPDWIFIEHQKRTTLFLQYDVGVSEGLTPFYQQVVSSAVRKISDLNARLKQEHWKLLVVPVPSKISICRESIRWPLLELDKYSRHPIRADATDWVFDLVLSGLQAGGVDFIDLRPDFRRENDGDPSHTRIFPLAESHWTGRAIEIAADRVTAKLHATYGLQTDRQNLKMETVGHYCDLAQALELSPIVPNPLSKILEIQDKVPFDQKVRAGPPRSLLAVAGTSYSGQYSWFPRAGFAATLDAMLPLTRVVSFAEAGHGSLHTMMTFLAKRSELYKNLEARPDHLITAYDKYLVWEFPIRDLRDFLPAVFQFSPVNATSADGGEPIVVEAPNGLETVHDKSLFWLNDQPATVRFREANHRRVLLLSWVNRREPQPAGEPSPILEFSVGDNRFTCLTTDAGRNVMNIPISEKLGELKLRCTNFSSLAPSGPKNRGQRASLVGISDLKAKFVDSTE